MSGAIQTSVVQQSNIGVSICANSNPMEKIVKPIAEIEDFTKQCQVVIKLKSSRTMCTFIFIQVLLFMSFTLGLSFSGTIHAKL